MANGLLKNGLLKKRPCTKLCPPSTKLNPVTCECVKIEGVKPPKGKKGMIIKSKKK